MENFDQILKFFVENEGIGLNTNILETGVINIAALIVIVFFASQQLLTPVINGRFEATVNSVKDAEDRLEEAKLRLSEARKQLSQADIVLNEIKTEKTQAKKVLIEAEVYQVRKELDIRFSRALANLRSQERQAFLEIKDSIILLVLNRTVAQARETFASEQRARAFLDDTINKLEGDLL